MRAVNWFMRLARNSHDKSINKLKQPPSFECGCFFIPMFQTQFNIYAALLLLFSITTSYVGWAQKNNYIESELARRAQKDSLYSDTLHSPLNSDSIASFSGLNYFAPDEDYVVKVKVKEELGKIFEMPTSSGKVKQFRQFAVLHFKLKGKKLALPIYQNMELLRNPIYRDYLFIPFTDLTNGEETYGGGRYIEARIPKDGEKLILDFNQCFNPYCHYSNGYNCPIPPKENFLNLRIEAGEKLLYTEEH